MTMEEDVKDIKKRTISPWYMCALLCGLGIGQNCSQDRQTEKLESAINKSHQVQTANVLGSEEAPEKFYEMNGSRVYLEIDGKPVEEYVKSR